MDGSHHTTDAEVAQLQPKPSPNPRVRFMFATYLLRARSSLSDADRMAAFRAQNVFQLSPLVYETGEIDADAAGRIVRMLAPIDQPEARDALGAVGDMLAPPLAGAEAA